MNDASKNILTKSIFFNNEEITDIILLNIIKMLISRKWVLENRLQDLVKSLKNVNSEDNIYSFDLDVDLNTFKTYKINKPGNFNGKRIDILILLVNQKISIKSPIIVDFLNKNFNHKIIVLDSINSKKNNLTTDKIYSYVEIFNSYKLMLDLISHDASPSYEILNDEEKKIVLDEYSSKEEDFPILNKNGEESKYFFLKEGQMVRIVRKSEVTLLSVIYKIVK